MNHPDGFWLSVADEDLRRQKEDTWWYILYEQLFATWMQWYLFCCLATIIFVVWWNWGKLDKSEILLLGFCGGVSYSEWVKGGK